MSDGPYAGFVGSVPGDTSEAAAESATFANNLRRRIHAYVGYFSDGLTCDEVETRLTLRHQTASARIRELVLMGLLQDSGKRRPTRAGRAARVYTAMP